MKRHLSKLTQGSASFTSFVDVFESKVFLGEILLLHLSSDFVRHLLRVEVDHVRNEVGCHQYLEVI